MGTVTPGQTLLLGAGPGGQEKANARHGQEGASNGCGDNAGTKWELRKGHKGERWLTMSFFGHEMRDGHDAVTNFNVGAQPPCDRQASKQSVPRQFMDWGTNGRARALSGAMI